MTSYYTLLTVTSYDAGRDMGQKIRSSGLSMEYETSMVSPSEILLPLAQTDQKYGGNKILRGKVVINDESLDVSQLLGARTRAVPQSLRLCLWPWLSILHFFSIGL